MRVEMRVEMRVTGIVQKDDERTEDVHPTFLVRQSTVYPEWIGPNGMGECSVKEGNEPVWNVERIGILTKLVTSSVGVPF